MTEEKHDTMTGEEAAEKIEQTENGIMTDMNVC